MRFRKRVKKCFNFEGFIFRKIYMRTGREGALDDIFFLEVIKARDIVYNLFLYSCSGCLKSVGMSWLGVVFLIVN